MDQLLTGSGAYDPSKIVLTLGGWEPYGWAADTRIVVTKSADIINPYVGTDGDVSLAKNRNKMGTMTLNLQRTSDANAVLASFVQTSYTSVSSTTFSVYLEDPYGYTISTTGWIQSQPEDTMGSEIGVNAWVIGLLDASLYSSDTAITLNAITALVID